MRLVLSVILMHISTLHINKLVLYIAFLIDINKLTRKSIEIEVLIENNFKKAKKMRKTLSYVI